MKGKANIVFGGQAGSEGKGAIVGYLARKHNYKFAICSFMTNAGHTWVGDNDEKVVVQQIPMSVVNKDTYLAIGPGSVITLEQLFKEIDTLEPEWDVKRRLVIDPRAMIIEEQDRLAEAEGTKYLASTMKGCGAALARKARRSKDVRLARDIPELHNYIEDTVRIVNDYMDDGYNVMVEGSQGFDLDINHGIEYPYCTSRQCTPAQVFADCGIPLRRAGTILAVIRSYPIRVGHVVEDGQRVGDSGPFGGEEVSFDQIKEWSGADHDLTERTTVTQRVRRIFKMDVERLKRMVRVCGPTGIALTFADYLDAEASNADSYLALPSKVKSFVATLERELREVDEDMFVDYVKTGPKDSQIIHI